jgi:hypothetical protein
MAKKGQSPATWGDRVLAFMDGDDPASELAKARAFQWIFVLIVCVEYWTRANPKWNDLGLSYWVGLPLVSALGVATVSARWGRLAFAALAIAQSVRIWNDFPGVGNHSYLEFLISALCAFLDIRQREERTLFLRAVRWMTCVVFFYAGLQKLVHGYYFRGELLAYSIGIEAFKPVLQLLLPHDDYLRLSQYHGKPGDGPYLVSGWLMLLLSNATYMFEMGLVPLLVWRRTRQFAVVGGLLFLLGIELAAREVFFGLIYINMLLLFCERDVNRRLLAVFAAVLACLLLVRWKILPEVIFY